MPRGAFNPIFCLTNRAGDVRAAILLVKDGTLKPNFIVFLFQFLGYPFIWGSKLHFLFKYHIK
jgi:hypothetical protein